jgi:hypothetical protein
MKDQYDNAGPVEYVAIGKLQHHVMEPYVGHDEGKRMHQREDEEDIRTTIPNDGIPGVSHASLP